MPQEHSVCLLCGSTSLTPLKDYSHAHLVKCNSCDFVFCKRIPSSEELTKHYNSYPRNNSISAITIKRYNELLDVFEKYRRTNNILDIGCGDGYFLETAQKRGWNVHGTEFTDDAIAVCRSKQIAMQKGALNATSYPESFFDIITSFEVIEHINNPQEEILNINTLLRIDGAFYVTTPNFNSISRNIVGYRWNIIEYPEHLSYYTAKTITNFFQSNGFKKNQLITTGISIKRINRSIDKASNETGNADEALRKKTETRMIYKFLKSFINFSLNTFKKGDSLKAIFIKN